MLSLQGFLGTLPLLLLTLDINFAGSVGHTGMKGSTSLSALLIVAWSTMLKGIDCTNKEVEQHLEMGKKMLAAGQLADALSHYHAAVEGDPSNYMTYYRRATVYLAMGKSKSALPDLDKVIELKPDFTAARLQRGNVRLKQGKLDEAQGDFDFVAKKEPGNVEAQTQLNDIRPLRGHIQDARDLYEAGEYAHAVEILGLIIEKCPWDPEMRELRAESYIQLGDYFKAVGDIRPTTKLRNDNTAAFYKLSTLYYEMGEADTSLMEIRECLKLDPDHKDCFPHYKKVKKLNKQMSMVQGFINEQQWEDCVSKADQMLQTEPRIFPYVLRGRGHRCHCYAKAGQTDEALKACQEVFDLDANNHDALCDRAEAYIANQQFDEAIADYRKAQDAGHNTDRVEEGLNRAQKLLKQSQKRDYYKILGVKRNAKKREIEKAYRKLAAQWHPDQFKEEEKEEAEKMFINIAAAKEVLTDPEKRQKFDNGEDPLDPEEQANQGGGGPFWHQGFNPFGSGGFGFKFHFN